MSDNDSREVVNRGDDPYPADIKVEAVTLVYETGNLSEAARQMKERYPDRHPNRQLITRWFKQTDPEALAALSVERKESFETGIMELGDKARQKMYDALDDMNPTQVPIPAGIAMDKALRLLEIERRSGGGNVLTYGPTIIVTGVTAPDTEVTEGPDTVEGEVVRDDDPGETSG